MVLTMYTPSIRAPKYMKQKLIESWKEKQSNPVETGDSSIPFSATKRTTRLEITKYIGDLNNVIKLQDLTDIYRTLHPTIAGYIFFSSSHGTFMKMSGLNNKTNHNKFRRI